MQNLFDFVKFIFFLLKCFVFALFWFIFTFAKLDQIQNEKTLTRFFEFVLITVGRYYYYYYKYDINP